MATISPLRQPSPRPELVSSHLPGPTSEPLNLTQVGFAQVPLGLDRVLDTLPLKNGGPHLIAPALVLHDGQLGYIIDPEGNLIGESNAVWVQRMLPATTTLNTRRL